MPLDYFIWLLRAPDGQEIVVDTGFDEETAAGRGRTIARNVRDSLKAMGTDAATSVVDARCRVHGVDALRVVDCSIIPAPVSGNTNGPAMAVAERAAELIRADARG